MSTSPESEFDLEKLFLPAWAQEPASANRFAKYEGEEGRDPKGDRRGPRVRSDRAEGERQRKPDQRGGGGPRREGRSQGPQNRERGPRREERPQREPPAPLPELNVAFTPDGKGVESLARQIKMTGRAYPLFDIARLILEKPERYTVAFSVKKKPDGQPAQPLFACALDDTLWLSEDEAVAHVLKNHFNTFYQAERTATEPPKGKYTFVAQCGLSGAVLGPPNYHDYQNRLRKLHAERFARMPFEAYKSRVKIVRDDEIVKKWIEEQSWKTDYVCLNMPEPLRLATMEEVEKHFREAHKDNIIKPAESHTLTGMAARSLRSADLVRLFRQVVEEQKRFPLQIATALSQQFATHGLQFFKVNRTITHVSVARPHYLDLETTPVSDGVKRIVEFINSHPKCTRRKLMESLAPSGAKPRVQTAGEPAEGAIPHAAPSTEAAEPTPEQTSVISDLHWLIHQGHVIEFANGVLDTAKKPLPRPPKPEKKPAEKLSTTAAEPEPGAMASSELGEAVAAETSTTAQVAEEPAAPNEDAPSAVEAAQCEAAPTTAGDAPAETPQQAMSDEPVETPAAPLESRP
jgi:hypothetical protein